MQILTFKPFSHFSLSYSVKHQEIPHFLMPSSFIKNNVNHFVWLGEMNQNIAQNYQHKQRIE